MKNLTENEKWWLSGHSDGDACVEVMQGCKIIRITIDKAEKGIPSLKVFQAAFGGSEPFKVRDATETKQKQFRWSISGKLAVEVCKLLWPYTRLKQNQFKLASTWPEMGSNKGVKRLDDNFIWESITAAADALGMKRHKLYALAAEANGEAFAANGTDVQLLPEIDHAPLIAQRREINRNLKAWKHQEHDVIDGDLPPAYFAGFFDAEGCIEVRGKNGIMLETPQNWPAVLNAAQVRYGGTVRARRGDFMWGVYSIEGCRTFLNDVLPFLIEKKSQAELVLDMDDNAPEIKQLISALKGNQGRYRDRVGLAAACFGL